MSTVRIKPVAYPSTAIEYQNVLWTRLEEGCLQIRTASRLVGVPLRELNGWEVID